MNRWQGLRRISFLSIVGLLLVACSPIGQEQEQAAVLEVEAQASPTVEQEPETAVQGTATPTKEATEIAVDVATINLSADEELVLVAGFTDDPEDVLAGYAAEGEEITSPGPTIRVRKGETVTITFENAHYFDGRPFLEPHNFTVVADKDVPVGDMVSLWGANVGGSGDANLKSGERGSVTFTPDTTGTFIYVCAFSDHIDQGMWGLFIVYE